MNGEEKEKSFFVVFFGESEVSVEESEPSDELWICWEGGMEDSIFSEVVELVLE